MSEPWGLLAEFDEPQALVAAVHAARNQGYRYFETYAPFAIAGLHPPAASLGWLGACGALGGATFGLLLQVGTVLAWPINVGGRLFVHWPSLLIVTFLLSVLGAAVASVATLLWQARLPLLHHPLFDAAVFARACDDRFLLCIRAEDPLFQLPSTHRWLAERAIAVSEVPRS